MPLALTSRRTTAALVVLLAIIAAGRIAHTWSVFSQTIDEQAHIAAGFEWLKEGRYTLDVEHPPLARIFFALDAYVGGARVSRDLNRNLQGNELFYRDGDYVRNLAAARAGNLPFFFLGLAVVYLWATRLGGRGAGVVAAALFGALPPVLAHAGVATTDMAAASTLAAALYALWLWLDAPSWRRTLLLGLAVGAGMVSKFSFLLFFPLGAVVLVAGELVRRRRWIPARSHRLAAAAAVALVAVGGAYRFQAAPLADLEFRSAATDPHSFVARAARYSETPGYEWITPRVVEHYHRYAVEAGKRGFVGLDFTDWAKAAGYPSPLAGRSGRDTMAGAPAIPEKYRSPSDGGWGGRLLGRATANWRRARRWVEQNVPIPAITFIDGADFVRHHSATGHTAYLFGELRQEGWWYYFPVVLFFKTPLAFLAFASAGAVILVRRGEALALVPLVLLAAAMTSKINIGVRHVLPMYPLLTIAAALAVVTLWGRWRVPVALLLGWYFIATAIAHPDYLAYFNEAAGRHPERIAADSNLDWGQDLFRLTHRVNRRKLKPLHISYFGTAEWARHITATDLKGDRCVEGWIAVSEMHMIFDGKSRLAWLARREPVERIGKSIRLYFVPRGECGADGTGATGS